MQKILIETVIKRAITMMMSVFILVGSMACYGTVVLATSYDSDEIVIETSNFNASGTTFINGQVLQTGSYTDIHDGIIRILEDSTKVYDTFIYGDNTFTNENSIFSNDLVQINVNEANMADIIVAEGDITINASTMRSVEDTIIYSKGGDIRINVGQMEFGGIIYAPNGEVTFSASNVHIQGRVIADEVNIYAGVFQIDGLETYSNMVDKLEFLSNDMILEMTRMFDKDTETYSIEITSDNQNAFEQIEVYCRYTDDTRFEYLCKLDEFESVGLAEKYDTVDIVLKATTRYNESVYSNVRSFHMDDGDVELAHLDTDEDGISDGEEVLFTKTSPYKADTDGDGISDYIECFYLLTNPNVKTSDADFDEDGLSNFEEIDCGTNPFLQDCDFDGILDGDDIEPLIYDNIGVEADYNDTSLVIGKYDKVINGLGEDGSIYQYVYNEITKEVKASCYNDEEITYFYDIDSNLIADVRRYQDEYRVSSSKYDTNGNIIAYSNNKNVYTYVSDELGNIEKVYLNGTSIVSISDTGVAYGNGDTIKTVETDNGYRYYVNDEQKYEIYSNIDEGVEYYIQNQTGIQYDYLYNDDAIDTVRTSTGYESQYVWSEETYDVTYIYNDVSKEQTIYLNSKSDKTIMISGDEYNKEVFDDSIVYTISDGDSNFFNTVYAFDDDVITEVSYNESDKISYEYNDNNQIITISNNGVKIWEYEYNLIGQLISSYDYVNKIVEKYDYDMYNNI